MKKLLLLSVIGFASLSFLFLDAITLCRRMFVKTSLQKTLVQLIQNERMIWPSSICKFLIYNIKMLMGIRPLE